MLSLSFFLNHPDLLTKLSINHSDNNSLLQEKTFLQHHNNIQEIISKIQPRVQKSQFKQKKRTKTQAEVFTPAWLCNQQNNLIDSKWFGTKSSFNVEGIKSWKTRSKKVSFPKTKNWQDYINSTRLEICCGEAPYLTSRYDAVSGNEIPVKDRIGLLDRKLRIVSENTNAEQDWIKYAIMALQSVFGYEKSEDNLLIARINLFFTFLEHHQYKFEKELEKTYLLEIAEIITWNLWQMDCMDEKSISKALIMNWGKKETIPFNILLH